jgi:hypothetical protein
MDGGTTNMAWHWEKGNGGMDMETIYFSRGTRRIELFCSVLSR